ncbi:MAG: glycosyltransferase family 4 protein [Methanospirillum sp.]|uniref:glycosyltransferase family 4 protein n=1 Tax=Methanospirillum sp. TaxID=45200 RepID=UPI00236A5376|nr:glycosyltransferase family 4 protein [Methanospirillum sp.]MDD1727801.1 glycosyltransferase family 4 protein [Methanospirillum sp.]
MKIGYIYDVIYPETIGGVEKRIHEIGVRLAARGHEIHLYGMKYWDGPDIIEREGMVLHGVCPAMGLYTEGRRSILQAVRYTIGLVPHLLKSEMEIFDCQNFPYFPAILLSIFCRLKKRCLVVTWHEFWGRYWFDYLGDSGLLGLLIERIALVLSPRVIAVSLLTAHQMKDTGYAGDVTRIPNGIDTAAISAVSPSQETSDLIFVGRFIPEKHPELVIDAVRILIDEYPDLHAMLIGDGPDFVIIRERIQQYGLSGHITCKGFVKDHEAVIGLMKASKVYVLPSEREGFGIAAIEAMACGLSIVTADHPRNAATSHVLPGAGACTSLNPEDIAAGIRYCLQNRPDYVSLASYVAAHDWDQVTRDLEQYYRTTITDSCQKQIPDQRCSAIFDIFRQPEL